MCISALRRSRCTENGGLRRLGRIEAKQLLAFAQSLGPRDHVMLECTAMKWAIAELLSELAGRVTVSLPMRTRTIAGAKVKTDKIDAEVLAQLGAADFLPEVWAPDQVTRALRRRVAYRWSLVRQRTVRGRPPRWWGPDVSAASPSRRRDHPRQRPRPRVRSRGSTVPTSGRSKLRARTDHPAEDHRQAQISLPARRAIQQLGEFQSAGDRHPRVRMPSPERALDLKRILGVHQRLAGEDPPDRVDRLRWEVREVRERLLLDLPILAVGTAQQRRRVLTIP